MGQYPQTKHPNISPQICQEEFHSKEQHNGYLLICMLLLVRSRIHDLSRQVAGFHNLSTRHANLKPATGIIRWCSLGSKDSLVWCQTHATKSCHYLKRVPKKRGSAFIWRPQRHPNLSAKAPPVNEPTAAPANVELTTHPTGQNTLCQNKIYIKYAIHHNPCKTAD